MKASLFCNSQYIGSAPNDVWPLSGKYFDAEAGMHSMRTVLDQFKLADELGFDWLAVAEHHYSPFSLCPNPMLMAAAVSQVTSRAKIAVLGPTIPILNPVRVAEELAMVDLLSGGRLVAGLMRGTANEYVTYNHNPGESRERFAESLKLIRRCWSENEPFGWAGRYYDYRTISIWPRPVQRPSPPIYISASSPESGEFAAQNEIGVGFAFTTIPHAKKAAEHYRSCARTAGWEPTSDQIIYRALYHLADTDEEAFAGMATLPPRVSLASQNKGVFEGARKAGYFGTDFTGQTTRNATRELNERIELGQVIVGSPETALKQIRRIRDQVGAGIIDFVVGVQLGDKTMRSIELLGTKVLPVMREL
jgi:alkanesulfonate monooxygenase SsuD/methylene tetrahydromethanopterin reductase-like flavin-dependent oxidoreductase (luciferase family)